MTTMTMMEKNKKNMKIIVITSVSHCTFKSPSMQSETSTIKEIIRKNMQNRSIRSPLTPIIIV